MRPNNLTSQGTPALSSAMTEDLLKVQTTKFICDKPFDQMNPVEKQERIKFLWRKLRSSVRFLKTMGSIEPDEQALGGVDLDDICDTEGMHARAMSEYRWYIVRTD